MASNVLLDHLSQKGIPCDRSIKGRDCVADVRVRKLDEWVVGWFRAQASRHSRSLEGELRRALTEACLRSKREVGAALRADLEQLEAKYGRFSDSASLIREDRDRRG